MMLRLRLCNLVAQSAFLPKDDFRRAVEKELTGREEKPSELIYFKVYKSQIPVIEQTIDTTALMLRSRNSSFDQRKIRIKTVC